VLKRANGACDRLRGMHLIPPAMLIKRTTSTALATHTHIGSYVGNQLKFDTQITRAILILTSTWEKLSVLGRGEIYALQPQYPLHLRHSRPNSQSQFLQSGSLMLRPRDGLKGGKAEQRSCALAPLRHPAWSRAFFNCKFAAHSRA